MDAPTTLYVVEQGAHVHRVGGRVLVRDARGAVLQDVPVFRLERVVLVGNIEVTTAAFVMFAREEIDLVYLTREGRFRCRASPLRLGDAELRLAQYRRAGDEKAKLGLSRRLVAAKIQNCRSLLRRKPGEATEEAGQLQSKLKLAAQDAMEAPSVESLMGVEGNAAREYFSGMRAAFKQELGFERRERRPPKDPVNAMLSFGYTLLYGQVLSAVLAAGLDPHLGNLHELKKHRPSLALDLMEEQRPVVDSVVMGVVNRVQVTARDFQDAGENGVRMTEQGLARFVKAYHDRMKETVYHEGAKREVDYREYAKLQAQAYRGWVTGEGEYEPLVWR